MRQSIIVSCKENKNSLISIRYIITLIATVLATLLFSLYIAGFAIVSGESMQPTFDSGDIVIVSKISKNFSTNDVAIVDTIYGIIIKRVIGCPGDTVQIKNGDVYVNGALFDDLIDIKIEQAGIAAAPVILGDGEYFVLGDNRNESKDSRFDDIGIIKENEIKGKVLFSLIPPKAVNP